MIVVLVEARLMYLFSERLTACARRGAFRRGGGIVLVVALAMQQSTTRASHDCNARPSAAVASSTAELQHHMNTSQPTAPSGDRGGDGDHSTMPGRCTNCATAPIAIVIRGLVEIAPEDRAFDVPAALRTRIDVAPDVPPPRN
jgi:hypothetical protein